MAGFVACSAVAALQLVCVCIDGSPGMETGITLEYLRALYQGYESFLTVMLGVRTCPQGWGGVTRQDTIYSIPTRLLLTRSRLQDIAKVIPVIKVRYSSFR